MNSFVTFGVLLVVVCLFSRSQAVRCSFYGEPGSGPTGEQMADGDHYNPNGLTCATLPHVPLGSIIQVTNQRSRKSIEVRVTDRIGGTQKEDTIDLTYGAFGLLADHEDGEIPCSYTIISGETN